MRMNVLTTGRLIHCRSPWVATLYRSAPHRAVREFTALTSQSRLSFFLWWRMPTLAGHWHRAEDALDDVVGFEAVELGFGFEHDTVAQHGGGDRLHVVGRHVVAVGERGQRFAGVEQAQRAAHAGAILDVGHGSC